MGRNIKQWEELKDQRLRIQCKSGILMEGLPVGLEGTLLQLTATKLRQVNSTPQNLRGSMSVLMR